MTFERFGRWLDTKHQQPRWLMILLWTTAVTAAINGIGDLVEMVS